MTRIEYGEDTHNDPELRLIGYDYTLKLTNNYGFQSSHICDEDAIYLQVVDDDGKQVAKMDMSFDNFAEMFQFVLDMYEKFKEKGDIK